jgi:hypothetical protein
METSKLQAGQERPHIDRLLQSLVMTLRDVPDYASVVHDRGELPSYLQQFVSDATNMGQSWCCWADNGFFHIWLFIAELSLPLSRERGIPVLEVKCYREYGLKEIANWAIDRQGRWHRVVGFFGIELDDDTLPAFEEPITKP